MSRFTRPSTDVRTVDISVSDAVIPATRGIYVGVAGALVFKPAHSGTPVTYANAVAGYHPISVKTIVKAGTTASDIHALY